MLFLLNEVRTHHLKGMSIVNVLDICVFKFFLVFMSNGFRTTLHIHILSIFLLSSRFFKHFLSGCSIFFEIGYSTIFSWFLVLVIIHFMGPNIFAMDKRNFQLPLFWKSMFFEKLYCFPSNRFRNSLVCLFYLFVCFLLFW